MHFKLYFLFAIGLVEGLDRPHRLQRDVGCQNATDNKAPYQASLRNTRGVHFCGGTIISDQWILTAAQCTIGQTSISMYVVVGTTSLSKGGDTHKVAKIHVHEQYENKTNSNDVSLIKISGKFKISYRVQVAQLPTKNTGSSAMVVLTGWGSISFNATLYDGLQVISLSLYAKEECQQIYIRIQKLILDSQICTAVVQEKISCIADSGGPLVANGSTVVGVVSSGNLCANGYPYVYTSTYAFRSWILIKISKG